MTRVVESWDVRLTIADDGYCIIDQFQPVDGGWDWVPILRTHDEAEARRVYASYESGGCRPEGETR